MPKAAKGGLYAVAKGRVPGIYSTWDECQAQVSGFVGNKHKKFPSAAQAREYLAQHGVSVAASSAGGDSAVSSSAHAHRSAKPYTKPAPGPSKSNGAADTSTEKPRSTSSRWASLTTEVIADESGWDVVYSDGACKGNGQRGSVAGVGVWWGENDARCAIVRVLETTPHTKRPLLIKTDSKYSISCFREWMPKWMRNGWKSSTGQPVKNAPLIRYLAALLDLRAREGQKVHLQYVKGHAGIEGNEGADQLANHGATLPAESERDWAAPVDGLDVADEAYADGLLDDDDLLAELAES
ncbi:ribonuclease H-like domain-containing protein [Daedaleopsis nitida]|nr:ribonuclease H-like domain-containing protein [Daedaleopsis nitida]